MNRQQESPFIFYPATWDVEVFMNMFNYGIKDNHVLNYNQSSNTSDLSCYTNSFDKSYCDNEDDMKSVTWLSCIRCLY